MLHYHSVASNSWFFLGFKLQVVLCKNVHMYKDSSGLTLNNSACCSSFSSLEGINSRRTKMLIWAKFVFYSSSSPNGPYHGCRHYHFAQLRYLLRGCQIFIQNFVLVSENNNTAIASATVCTQSEIFLWWSVSWNMRQHGVLCMPQSPTYYVKPCQLMTTACRVLFRDSLLIKKMDIVIYNFFCLSKRCSNRT